MMGCDENAELEIRQGIRKDETALLPREPSTKGDRHVRSEALPEGLDLPEKI